MGVSSSSEKVVAYSDRVEITATLTDPSLSVYAVNGNREKSDTPEGKGSRNPVALFHMERTALPVTVVWLGSGEA